jgi:hypothetical protein
MRHLRSCISIFTSKGSCLKSLTAKSIFAAMLILLSSASLANNLVTDGTFDEATSTTWYGNAYNPVDGVNQADIGAAGNAWDVNLSGYVNVAAGQDYTLSFDVSGGDRTIIAGIGQSAAPYLGHTDTVTLSATTQTIVMHLNASLDGAGVDTFGGDTTRVIFDMGADTGAVSIDNVSLTAGHTGTVNLGVAGEPEPELTPADGFVITEAFGDTVIGDGSLYTFPAAAQSWGGFANMNTSLYPITVTEDSVITFTGSVPAGGDADVRFRFEFNPHPDVEPSFNTAAVTVSGADAATYSVDLPAQGANTFSSFIMFLDTRDVGVVVTDIAISAAPAGPADSDNDGVNDDEDAFPNDPSETVDTDNDGIGNNADSDDDGDGIADVLDEDPLDSSNTSVLDHQTVFVNGQPKGMLGSDISITVGYDVSNDDSSLTGLGLRVHYDSSALTFVELSNVLAADNISADGPYSDDDNFDGDASTDKYVAANWASLFGSWPGELPSDLLTVTFTVADDDTLESTVINFSSNSNAAGYAFAPTNYTLDMIAGSFDFDGNGTADALTDGLMLLRYAFGLSGSAVTDGAIAGDSPMTAEQVLAALETASDSFADIDGNGVVDALTDGLMLLRALFGLSGDAVISGAVGGGATRTTAADIEAYIDSMTLYLPCLDWCCRRSEGARAHPY